MLRNMKRAFIRICCKTECRIERLQPDQGTGILDHYARSGHV